MIKQAGQNALHMKLMNRLRVLRLIRRGAIARSELADKTGLTPAAISIIVADLLQDGVLVEIGLGRNATGRKRILLELRPEYAYAVGLILSRTGAEVGLVNLAGQLL